MNRPALAGGLIAALFFMAVFGTAILDPRNVAWLLHDDPAQHYLGFAFFRHDGWSWPPGRIPDLGIPAGTALVYTDSIPLLALPLKLFATWLPSDFQYFGIWMACCYVLAGFFATRIALHLGAPVWPALIASTLLVTSPALALRAYGHESLMAHWLLLAAIDAYLSKRTSRQWWLIITASLVHAYWVVILFPIALVAWWRGRLPWWGHVAGIGVLIAVQWLAGYFVARPGQLAAEGYGDYSANLLTFFDPMNWQAFLSHYGRSGQGGAEWSTLLPSLGQVGWGQYEGFAYLGAGTIILIATAIFVMFRGTIHLSLPLPLRELGWLLVPSILLFVYALSTRITFSSSILLDIPLNATSLKLLSVFRATGRFVWPLAWLLPLLSLGIMAARLSPIRLAGLLFVCLILQIIDLTPKWREFNHRFSVRQMDDVVVLQGRSWEAAGCYRRLIVLPANVQGNDWIAYAHFAAHHNQAINLAYTARADETSASKAEMEELEALRSGVLRSDTAYVLRDPATVSILPHNLGQRARILSEGTVTLVLPGIVSSCPP